MFENVCSLDSAPPEPSDQTKGVRLQWQTAQQQQHHQIENSGQTRHYRSEKIGRQNRERDEKSGDQDRRRGEEPGPGRSSRPPSTSRSASSSRSSDRLGDIVEPWTSRAQGRERAEGLPPPDRESGRSGPKNAAPARRKRATTEARKTRNRVERDVRKRQKAVTSTATSTIKTRPHRGRAPGQAGLRPALRAPLGPPDHRSTSRPPRISGAAFFVPTAPLGPR